MRVFQKYRNFIRTGFQNIIPSAVPALLKVTVEGAENIPDVPGALIVSNHISYLDVPLISLAFRKHLLKMNWIVSRDIHRLWFLQWVFWIYPVIVTGGGTIEKMKQALGKDRWIVIFPEGGERMCPPWLREEIHKKQARKGTAIIALSTGISIIPVGITGADKALPMRSFRLDRKHKVTIRVGKPFSYKIAPDNEMTDELVNKTKKDIIDRIYSLIDETPSDLTAQS